MLEADMLGHWLLNLVLEMLRLLGGCLTTALLFCDCLSIGDVLLMGLIFHFLAEFSQMNLEILIAVKLLPKKLFHYRRLLCSETHLLSLTIPDTRTPQNGPASLGWGPGEEWKVLLR